MVSVLNILWRYAALNLPRHFDLWRHHFWYREFVAQARLNPVPTTRTLFIKILTSFGMLGFLMYSTLHEQ